MQGFGTLAIYNIYPHICRLFYPNSKSKRKNVTLQFLAGRVNKFINQICKDKPQKCMLHFLVV